MNKMVFFSVTVFLIAFTVSAVSAQGVANPSILLKGGLVIDPANNINSRIDILIKDGKIASVAKNIPISEAKKVVDVSGYYVTPGFVDIHAHVFYTQESPRGVIARDYCFPYGVTTIVDAGSSGAETFLDFKKIIDNSLPRILAFLNISKKGMTSREYENDPYLFDVKLAAETAKKHPDIIVGFKTAHYDSWHYDGVRKPFTSPDSAMAAGDLADLPVMLDFHPAPAGRGYPERSLHDIILKKMRPGDIYTHVFYWGFPTVIDGKVNSDLFKAQKRGVYFDIGHGQQSFMWRNAVPAIKQGFWPNSISTDVHGGNTCGAMLNMTNIMSKFVCMGIPLEEVIRCSTINPAREIKRSDLGHLSAGAVADIAVFKLQKGDFGYTDARNAGFKGNSNIKNFMTLFGGQIVFDPYGLSATNWEDIPKDDIYWEITSGILY